jgi:aryl-alcohol dehydrogenase-like predicted oxidoreductase
MRRQLGNTGIEVGEIGLGAWQLGTGAWGSRGVDACQAIIEAALDAGGNFFDTAPGYAGGHSEEMLGRAFRGRRDQAVICTKFGHTADGGTDFDSARIRPSLEDSLRRLQTDYVDVLLLHNPPSDLLDESRAPHYAELLALQAEGKIRAFGASVDWAVDVRKVRESTPSQVLEVLFNAFHQDPLSEFASAQAGGVGLIVKVPLDSGWLSGKYTSASSFDDIRGRWSPSVIERRAALLRQLQEVLPEGVGVRDAALQYVLAQPQVSTIIPGAKSVEQVRANFSAAQGKLSNATVAAIRELWEREIKNNALPW